MYVHLHGARSPDVSMYSSILIAGRRVRDVTQVKFDILWLGPYIIDEVAGTNSFYLNDLEGESLSLLLLSHELVFFNFIFCL